MMFDLTRLDGLTLPIADLYEVLATQNTDGSVTISSDPGSVTPYSEFDATATSVSFARGTNDNVHVEGGVPTVNVTLTYNNGQPPFTFLGIVRGYTSGSIFLQDYNASSPAFTNAQNFVVTDSGAPAPSSSDVFTMDGSNYVPPPCFFAGTRILTQRGEVAVEDLRVGDRVRTVTGRGDVMKPVVWVGRSPFDTARHPRPAELWPIRISANALGAGLPTRELVLSPGHSLLLHGVLIQAERLVNGASIVQDRAVTRGEYFHFELAEHDVILAEGVPSESYLDTGNRGAFANGGGAIDLHPDHRPRHWRETCLPLVQDGPVLAAVRARLLEIASACGWRLDSGHRLHIVAGGRTIMPASVGQNRYSFVLPPHCTEFRLLSRHWVPAQVDAEHHDTRRLGVCVTGIKADDEELALDAAELAQGWHNVEVGPAGKQRWTQGSATIRTPARRVTVTLGSAGRYWLHRDGIDIATPAYRAA